MLRTLLKAGCELFCPRGCCLAAGDHYYATAASGGLPGGVVLPPPAMALEWAGVTLDANMARLVLQQEASGLG